ncbi:ABC transporter permease [uncultured Propionibacterium sp.]|uniref:ABC transporter permease n=1 Tax=uncultured Propionibacterium sp. TaxID=218066 RepID=UPI00292ECF11|nr:ABC transporter permease [uncultured Propionibacterium sp.]
MDARPAPALGRGLAYLARQAGLVVFSSVAVFAVTRALPTTPMEAYLEQHGLPATQENMDALARQWGLTGSPPEQYLGWIRRFVTGDWGTSIASGASIRDEIMTRLPLSLAIGLGGVAIAFVLAYPLGMKAATGNRLWDALARIVVLCGEAVPSFLVCTAVVDLLGVRLGLIPFYSLPPARAVVAPMLVVALYSLGQLSRVVTAHAEQLRGRPFVRAAVQRGFTVERVLWHDCRRPVLYGLTGAVVSKMAWVIGGASVVEYVFAVPGMSYYIISSIGARDYTVVQSYLMILVLWMFATRVLLGAAMAWLDPGSR